METFACRCGTTLFFPNRACTRCGRAVYFLPDQLRLSAVEPGDFPPSMLPVSPGVSTNPYRPCQNQHDYHICNWAVPAADTAALCAACRLNRTIPDLSITENLPLWERVESAKRHTLYTLLRLGLPVIDQQIDSLRGLAFDFLADKTPDSEFTQPLLGQPEVNTGHANGVITINIAEADPVARTRTRRNLGEQYRTLLGHFRHEIGHYYWQLLIAPGAEIEGFRECFGDERTDYGTALRDYYARIPLQQVAPQFISAYASAHPWEDWAECWAHYLHMTDTLETACDYGLRIHDRLAGHRLAQEAAVQINCPGEQFDAMLEDWCRLSVAINGLNRSMGLEDAYPFVITDAVRDKLAYVHAVIQRARSNAATGSLPALP